MNAVSRHHAPVWEQGGVRFQLWAPSAASVELLLNGEASPMTKGENGNYTTTVPAKGGDRYAFRIDGKQEVPDPASAFQPDDVHAISELVDPAYDWKNTAWQGRPWHETVVYELHVGTFSPEGTYAGIESRLDYLAGLGVTAIQLMPIAEFSGGRNWGYDGVLPYAPEASYGRPEELKRLIDAAHGKGMMVFLDVVYNHFGPDGNYVNLYAEPFFTEKYHTPWGAAIDVEGHAEVRHYFIENALSWLEDYRFDGLRFDAVHAICDASPKHFLDELSETIRARAGAERHVHLILENEHNSATLLAREDGKPIHFTAQWNDDFHHECHVLLTGETHAYYESYEDDTIGRLLRVLTQGFDYQGEVMKTLEKPRGEPSGHLPPGAFVNFLQNHDQVGNRAMGDRLASLVSAEKLDPFYALLLLSPFPPMLFMGEERGETRPFLFFCDFHDELADAVREGRRKEFARFPEFADPEKRKKIPDPNARTTFEASKIDWTQADQKRLAQVSELLALRRQHLMPLLASGWKASDGSRLGDQAIVVSWQFAGGTLSLALNLGSDSVSVKPAGDVIYGDAADGKLAANGLVAWVERTA